MDFDTLAEWERQVTLCRFTIYNNRWNPRREVMNISQSEEFCDSKAALSMFGDQC